MPPGDTMPEGTHAIIEGANVSSDETDEMDEAFEDAAPAAMAPSPSKPTGNAGEAKPAEPTADLREAMLGRIDGLTGLAGDKARELAQAGKDRMTDAIGEIVRMMEDAAQEIDAKVGTQYGDYARRTASSIDGMAQTIKDKDVDALFADARGLITRSPAAAIGVAATLGFVVARIVRAALPGDPPVKSPAA